MPTKTPSGRRIVLTAAQRARILELIVDEGWTRIAAVAWVLAFECTTEGGTQPTEAHKA